jgi:hypothetical protein
MRLFRAFALGLCAATASVAVARAQATPAPYSLDGTFSLYSVHTNGVNATSFTDLSNGLLTFTKNTGFFRFGVTAGIYAFPVVGQALYPTTQGGANTSLYGYVPSAYVAFVPNAHVTVSAGQLATLLGQEDGFTYLNVNVQRGLIWAAEPAFSRGVRVAYTQGKFSGDLEYDDGYYTASHRAVEGLVGWAPSGNTAVQVAFIAPQANTPGNATAAVANKTEYDVMLTQQIGKLALLPYVLLTESPASASLGYATTEYATGDAFLAQYAFNARYSIGARYEWFVDHSSAFDPSPNADFVGYGPGSRAATFTITPSYKMNLFFLRAEFSAVNAVDRELQTRVLVETGVAF